MDQIPDDDWEDDAMVVVTPKPTEHQRLRALQNQWEEIVLSLTDRYDARGLARTAAQRAAKEVLLAEGLWPEDGEYYGIARWFEIAVPWYRNAVGEKA